MLARLLHLCGEQRVGLVELPQALEHLGQLRRVERLGGDLEHRDGVEGEGPEDAGLVRALGGGDGARLDERGLDALDERPAAGGHLAHLDAVARLVEPEPRDRALGRVLLVLERVGLAEDVDRLPHFEGAREHAAEGVEGLTVGRVVHLGHVDHEEPLGVAVEHALHEWLVERAGVCAVDLGLGAALGRGEVRHHGVDEAGVGLAEEARDDELEHRLGVKRVLGALERQPELSERRLEVSVGGGNGLRHELVERLEDELHEGARPSALRGAAAEGARLRVEVSLAPHAAREGVGVEARVEVGVDLGVRSEREAAVEEGRGEDHRAVLRGEARVGASRGGVQAGVHFLDDLAHLEVGVLRRQAQLKDEAIDLVDDEHELEVVGHGVADEALAGGAEALDDVDDEEDTVREAEAGGYLIGEADVARGVDEVGHVVLLRGGLQK
mmetsp:Transcript_1943/g.4170  ORF Transcript_1943/g.4170 Transcript_1943/m.4170 type:complete len:441 (+) Transcript_1943:1187-2509(+)